jgi:hypothetical protein
MSDRCDHQQRIAVSFVAMNAMMSTVDDIGPVQVVEEENQRHVGRIS